MNQKYALIAGAVLVVLVGGYFLTKSMGSQNSQPAVETPPAQTNTVAPTAPGSQQTPATQSTTTQTSQNNIVIKDFKFAPATMTVKVGDSITWTNQDSAPHSATADDNSWDTGVLSTGKSGSVTFSKTGTFAYHCSVHPNMKATIVVQ